MVVLRFENVLLRLSDEGGALIPMFAAYVGAHSDALMHNEQVASNWRNDGHRIAERWWFA